MGEEHNLGLHKASYGQEIDSIVAFTCPLFLDPNPAGIAQTFKKEFAKELPNGLFTR